MRRPLYFLAFLLLCWQTSFAQGPGFLMGIRLNGGEATENQVPGTLNQQYAYPTEEEVEYYYRKGFQLVCLPFRWERIQKALGEELNANDVAAMRECLRRMDEALANETDGSEADDDFHLAIAAATQNQYVLRLSEFLGRQFSESRRMAWVDHPRGMESPREAQSEHYRLLDAIAAGDPAAARQAAFVHLSGAAERVGLSLPSDLGGNSKSR